MVEGLGYRVEGTRIEFGDSAGYSLEQIGFFFLAFWQGAGGSTRPANVNPEWLLDLDTDPEWYFFLFKVLDLDTDHEW